MTSPCGGTGGNRVAKRKKGEKRKGPKGGIKHQPGRGHASKSGAQKKKRFARKAAEKQKEDEETARRQWEEWDRLPEVVKRLLGPQGEPKLPRPKNDR
jgi:hypothetical protein